MDSRGARPESFTGHPSAARRTVSCGAPSARQSKRSLQKLKKKIAKKWGWRAAAAAAAPVVAVDVCSKFTVAAPVKDLSSDTITAFLVNQIYGPYARQRSSAEQQMDHSR